MLNIIMEILNLWVNLTKKIELITHIARKIEFSIVFQLGKNKMMMDQTLTEATLKVLT